MMSEDQRYFYNNFVIRLKKFHQSKEFMDGYDLFTEFWFLMQRLNPELSLEMERISEGMHQREDE